jgi:VanZ family protein
MYLENNQIHRYPIRAVIAWIAVATWMALIFWLSSQSGPVAGDYNRRMAEGITGLLRLPQDEARLASLQNLLSNLAHGTIFFVLALLTSNSLSQVDVQDFRNAVLNLCICALYAASDELHQAFVPGRNSQLSDFLIDGLGIMLATIIYQVISAMRFLRADLRVKREEDLRI